MTGRCPNEEIKKLCMKAKQFKKNPKKVIIAEFGIQGDTEIL